MRLPLPTALHSSLFLFLALSLVLLSSCEKRPDNILSKGKMRSVLYDYHLAQGMINELEGGHEQEGNAYIDAVFAKHGITVAQFDSSMVWYNAHNEELQDIYRDLKKQFTARHEELQLLTGSNETAVFATAGGDTTNIWVGPSTLLLRQRDILSLETFTFKADTAFHHDDHFLLMANVVFVDDPASHDGRTFTAALTIHNKEKRTFSQVRSTNGDMPLRLEISQADSAALRDLSVFFYYKPEGKSRSLCVVDNIRLYRMHQPKQVSKPEDAQPEGQQPVRMDDSTNVPVRMPERVLSPAELRQRSTDGKANPSIKKAPDVRTPNSIGPSRRKRVTH